MNATATQLPSAPGNSFSRIIGAFFSPKETFASIAERPTWLAPVILSCIVSFALIMVFSNRVGWAAFMQRQIDASPSASQRFAQMSPEQRQQAMALQVKISEPIGYFFSVAGPFIFTALLAAIFLGLFNLLYGAQIGFKTSMGVVAYGFLPRTLYALVGILVVFVKDPSQVDFRNLLASNPGALLSTANGTAAWLVALATQIDFFTFWIMILLAMGFRSASPKKISFGSALAGIAGLWLLWVVAQVGIAAATS